jgi:hypothetical protein
MVKECRKLFSTFLCSKNVTKSHVFLWFRHFRHFANSFLADVANIFPHSDKEILTDIWEISDSRVQVGQNWDQTF